MGIFITLMVIAILCFVGAGLISSAENNNEKIRLNKVDELIREYQIQVDKRYDAKLGFTLINDLKNKCLWCVYGASDKLKMFNYNDIIQVELMENDESINVTSRSSQLGGAIVGGALAGGVGAVIGGLSGKQIQKRTVRNIQLVLTLDDLDEPFFKFVFENFHPPVETTTNEYMTAHNQAFTWFKLLEVIIKRTEKEQIAKA
jgi:hypothetical protein